MMETVVKVLSVLWEVLKIAVIPVLIWYFEHQIQKQEEKRELESKARRKEQEEQLKKNTDIQFLMMERIDSLSDMTQLMARKLHDAGIINGDLEDMHQKYKGLNHNYEQELKRLALDVLNK